MKVLVISHLYPNEANKISGLFVHYQVRELVNQGIEVIVVSPVPYAPFLLGLFNKKWRAYRNIPKITEFDGVKIYHPRYLIFPRLMFYKYYGYNMYFAIRKIVKKLIKVYDLDIIHSHVAFPEGFSGSIFKEKYKIPHVVTIHGQDLQSTVKKGKMFEELIYGILSDADEVITVSNKLKNLIMDDELRQRVNIIPNGVNVLDVERATSFDHKKIDILSVSNLYKTKGIDLNILAIKKLVDMGYDPIYYVIGDGPEKEKLQRLTIDLDLERNVIFLGKLNNSEVLRYMKTADIFCLPSYEEGFGIAYIEAMACGKPAIAIKGQGIEDAIKNGVNGFLVNPDASEIAHTLKMLLDDGNLRKKIGQRAREDVLNNFTWQSSARKLSEIYKALLKKYHK